MHANARAFKYMCGICQYPKRAVKTKPPYTATTLGFMYIDYRVCDWCDKSNKGEGR